MANYVSKKFKSGEEFEAFLEKLAAASGLSLTYSNGNIHLKNEDETILGTIRLSQMVDGKTVKSENGYIEVVGIKETNHGSVFNMWVGTQEEYDKITERNTSTVYWITDDQTVTKLTSDIDSLKGRVQNLEWWSNEVMNGDETVAVADRALKAGEADFATSAGNANSALNAQFADRAAEAAHANTASSAERALDADTAGHAATSDHATTADNATNANHATTADNATEANTAKNLRRLFYHTISVHLMGNLNGETGIIAHTRLRFSFASPSNSPYDNEADFRLNFLFTANKVCYYDGTFQSSNLADRKPLVSYTYKSTNGGVVTIDVVFLGDGNDEKESRIDVPFENIEIKTTTVQIY